MLMTDRFTPRSHFCIVASPLQRSYHHEGFSRPKQIRADGDASSSRSRRSTQFGCSDLRTVSPEVSLLATLSSSRLSGLSRRALTDSSPLSALDDREANDIARLATVIGVMTAPQCESFCFAFYYLFQADHSSLLSCRSRQITLPTRPFLSFGLILDYCRELLAHTYLCILLLLPSPP